MSEKHVEAKLKASGQVQEYLEGIKVIKACGLDGSKFSALDNALHLMKKMAIKMDSAQGFLLPERRCCFRPAWA
jgi:ATP-binding cassette subfamily B protein